MHAQKIRNELNNKSKNIKFIDALGKQKKTVKIKKQ